MKITTLASGSSGNAIYVAGEKTGLLIDCGLTGKKAVQALTDLQENPEELAGIIVTHEHIDHVKGVGVMSRKYDLPVYATEKTWAALSRTEIGQIAEKNQQYLSVGRAVELGEIKLEIFATSHDAAEPIGLTAHQGELKAGIATDTGQVTRGMEKHLHNCDVLIIEANHDEEMLEKGPYPYHLKRRIKSEEGHLANPVAGKALTRWVGGETQQVVLAHLSQVNNEPYLARKTVEKILHEAGIEAGLDVQVTVAPREATHPLVELKKAPAWMKKSSQAG